MTKFLFGWLTKGQMELSLLDSLVAFGELIIVIAVLFVVACVIDSIKGDE